MIDVTKEYLYALDSKYEVIGSNEFQSYGYVIRYDNMYAYHRGWTFMYDKALVLDKEDAKVALSFYRNVMNLEANIVLVLPEDYPLEQAA